MIRKIILLIKKEGKMKKMEKDGKCECGCHCHHKKMSGCGGVYCLGFIGAAIYYIGTAATFGLGVLGFLKALVWPAFLVYAVLKYLGL
jgi:hypothetical protein